MSDYKVREVTTKEGIMELANQSALTFEGLSIEPENLENVVEWLEDNGALNDEELEFHVMLGELMNTSFELTGNNIYPEDLHIVSVTGINSFVIALKRFEVGGRWLDDIIDNNLRREN